MKDIDKLYNKFRLEGKGTRDLINIISPDVTYENGISKEDTVVYSDRLYQWNPTKYNQLCRKHFGNEGQFWNNRQPEKIEQYLSDYLEKEVKLTQIKQTENVSTGYPIWIFRFKEKKKDD